MQSLHSVSKLLSLLKLAGQSTARDVCPAVDCAERQSEDTDITAFGLVEKPKMSKATGNLNKLHPIVFWDPPAAVYLEPLCIEHFTAHCKDFKTRPVIGEFFFDPYVGTVFPAGTHELNVTFVPAKAHKYASVTATRLLTVKKRRPVVEWDFSHKELIYGTPLTEEHFAGVRCVLPGGTFIFSHERDRVLPIGTHKIAVEYEPAPEYRGNYSRGYATVTFDVVGTYVPIVWKIPFSAESYAHFTKHVEDMVEANTFVVDTPAVVMPTREEPDMSLRAGHRKRKKQQQAEAAARAAEEAAAVKASTKEYTPDCMVVVTTLPAKRRSSAFTAGAPIIYPEPLPEWLFQAEAVFYDAERQESVYVAGRFEYDPPVGAQLPAGDYTIQLTFYPADLTKYRVTRDSRKVGVLKSPVPLEWPLGIGMTEGATLDEHALTCTNLLNLPGTYHYDPPLGAALLEGRHLLKVRFDPEDSVNYHSATTSVPFQVRPKKVPKIHWAAPPDIVHPFPLSKLQLNAACRGGGFYRGTFVYEPTFDTVLDAGVHTLKVTFYPELPTVAAASLTVELVVHQGLSRLVWNTPEPLFDGQGLYDDVLTCTCTNLTGGTFIYDPPKGAVLNAGPHKLSVRYVPDDPNYTEAETYIKMQVRPKPVRAQSKYYVS
jgi:hypothetical protein